MNEEDCTEYETRQDRLRSPLIPQERVDIKETENELRNKRSD